MMILKIKDKNGSWVDVPAIVGPKGDDATVTSENIKNALGYTPANENHKHDEYSLKEHKHDEYITKDELEDLELLPGDNIEIVNNVISVLTTNDVDGDNTKPITSSAVYTTVGNIQELLKTI